MALPTKPYRALFQRYGKAYRIDARLLEAIAMAESGGRAQAFRYEPAKVDASYGLMQVMGATARKLGLDSVRDAALCEPDVGILMGTRTLADNLDHLSPATQMARSHGSFEALTLPFPFDMQAAIARYNGGPRGNPGDDGKTLRNSDYLGRVQTFFEAVVKDQ